MYRSTNKAPRDFLDYFFFRKQFQIKLFTGKAAGYPDQPGTFSVKTYSCQDFFF